MDGRLDEFPQPNPHFPDPPRPAEGWTAKGMYALALTFLASLAWMIAMIGYSDQLGIPAWLAIITGMLSAAGVVFGAVGTPLAAYNVYRLRSWRRGDIIPAIVVRAPRQIPWYLRLVALVLLAPPLDLLFWGLFGAFTAKVEFLSNGVIVRRRVIWDLDEPPEVSECCWILRSKVIKQIRFLHQSWAPQEWLDEAPPADVVEWLTAALNKADRKYSYKGDRYTKRA